ncbi:uncharacterized protein si:cabz01074946.1 isoform X2 [Notolabrus celidotus]|uniref:uncharacterized protein si:cabz01074946.1 isoform X2 n=1 Tax=Notolabrus celidotus TaxID=1203425 RepID=UPI00149033E1|nr:uncharacterized protein si:cabz01074946.1 isoform X2 [Notolabrus celidotus]
MKLQVLLLLLLQAFYGGRAVESLREAVGYLGGSVTLHLGADPAWKLTIIEWSIFKNTTWIATYRPGGININRVDRYKKRLGLNITTGDLTIHRLTMEDDMVFTVEFTNNAGIGNSSRIHLTVKRRPQQPTINTTISAEGKDGCLFFLNCSSSDEGVKYSWKVPPSSVFYKTDADDNSAVLLVFLNPSSDFANVTCTSSREKGSSSSNVFLHCNGISPPEPQRRPSHAFSFVGGFFLGTVLLLIIYFSRGKFCKGNNPA